MCERRAGGRLEQSEIVQKISVAAGMHHRGGDHQALAAES
jgi:hypothetical protein